MTGTGRAGTLGILVLAVAAGLLWHFLPGRPGGDGGGGLRHMGNHRVAGVVLRDERSGRRLEPGVVDLAPALERIAAGERSSHSNDGGVFRNAEGLLPRRERGYYREYVVPTPGFPGTGPQRLVLGQGGEVYYTPDHYRSFIRIDGDG